ncbi:MAG: pyruvate synthase subunit beta [Candidatus Aenigmarchaeota archaeon]|nr:pyruvate synthase subunit beta [Candidatus Aenigmarchaeota archaeon]
MTVNEPIESLNDLPKKDFLLGRAEACRGCGALIGLKLALKIMEKNTIVVSSFGCMTLLATYPQTVLKVPFIHVPSNPVAAASGIYHSLRSAGKEDINVLCYIGDGATYDSGLQSLSAAAVRKDNLMYICYNNQSYTGSYTSSATPYGAKTATSPKGYQYFRKSLAKIMASHNLHYVATASVAYPIDFVRKLQKALSFPGVKFIDLLTPCPVGWGFDPSNTIEVARMAVQTGAWPLYEIENKKFSLTVAPTRLEPVERYFIMQKRFSSLNKNEKERIQEHIEKEWKCLLRKKYWEVSEY